MPISPPVTPRLADVDAERVRREHDRVLRSVLALPAVDTRIINDVELEDGVARLIPHGLGRRPLIVLVSPPRGPVSSGRIEEIRSDIDRTKYISIEANGYGATVTVDVEIK